MFRITDHQLITGLIGTAVHLPAERSDRARHLVTEALALASFLDLPVLIEEAEGALGRIEHDESCTWCAGMPGAHMPPVEEVFWCTH
ncbi:hypothetical protein GCM10007304_46930 [Rhodococcoides trifolii]|uniref:Uncharacterized protein n=1 Tax=Rhodococcoides trifolii TaxID=908250 RepID=A0A917G8D8_9NOCA|nr:hypothetical protein [Rhodococcus trifolii]GGG27723.1 hypothetical protein GCM10007304_46930 [Rhodococcus trifolii]